MSASPQYYARVIGVAGVTDKHGGNAIGLES